MHVKNARMCSELTRALKIILFHNAFFEFELLTFSINRKSIDIHDADHELEFIVRTYIFLPCRVKSLVSYHTDGKTSVILAMHLSFLWKAIK